MRILVCGSRSFDDWVLLNETLSPYNLSTNSFIEGGAIGADFLCRVWCKCVGRDYVEYPADWKNLGKQAGSIRNKQMLEEGKPDKVIAFWNGKSSGTRHMIEISKNAGLPVEIVHFAHK